MNDHVRIQRAVFLFSGDRFAPASFGKNEAGESTLDSDVADVATGLACDVQFRGARREHRSVDHNSR